MGIKEKIMELEFVRNYILVSKFGNNIHDVDLLESIQTGIVNRLLIARELGIDYAVVIKGVIPDLCVHSLLAFYAVGLFGLGCYVYKKYNYKFLYY